MSELKKPTPSNAVVLISFLLSLVFMGIVTFGVTSGFIAFPDEGSFVSSSLGDKDVGCEAAGNCFENAPMDRTAIEQ